MHRRIVGFLFASGMAVATFAAERPLVIDPTYSHVEIAVKATIDSFVARLTAFEPAISIGDDGQITRGRIAVAFRELKTGKERRDEAMHKWQQTDTYPDVLFVLSTLERSGESNANATGQLRLHGVTRELKFPVSITREGARYAIDGVAQIDTRDFGLAPVRMLAVLKVDPVVQVRFHLQGSVQQPTGNSIQARR